MNTITTQRLNTTELKKVVKEHIATTPSQHKSNWVKFLVQGAENISEWKNRGFFAETVAPESAYVHASVTNISTQELVEAGVAIYGAQLGNEVGHYLVPSVLIKRVRPDLFRLSNTSFEVFVVAEEVETVQKFISQVRNLINANAGTWYSWLTSPDAKCIEVEGKKVFKFANGLSVRIDGVELQFCNVLHNGESYDFITPEEFYWWLKRFF